MCGSIAINPVRSIPLTYRMESRGDIVTSFSPFQLQSVIGILWLKLAMISSSLRPSSLLALHRSLWRIALRMMSSLSLRVRFSENGAVARPLFSLSNVG